MYFVEKGRLELTSRQRLLCLFNINEEPVELDLSPFEILRPVTSLTFTHEYDADRMRLRLPAWGVMYADLRSVQEMYERSAEQGQAPSR